MLSHCCNKHFCSLSQKALTPQTFPGHTLTMAALTQDKQAAETEMHYENAELLRGRV